jgi:Zn ribbon nucleic-acid-binding protein
MNECPVCHLIHSEAPGENECDYEECGECGFDHEYEPEQAQGFHLSHSFN